MSESAEDRRKELITQITAEMQSIKEIKFLQFYLEMTRAFKRKWGV